MFSRGLISLLFFFLVSMGFSQRPVKPSASDLHQRIRKLNVLGSVLYVAAHPDDENQRFISYCANHKLFDIHYLSLTRGDGGQNLIGSEMRELLGVLRTEELLMARSVDGGQQHFTRANDFGFSKSPEETLEIWDREAVLSDVVWVMRQTQPDVVVNRFYHDKKYDTHGHHTASGILSVEAFDLAGRVDAFPEQLRYVTPWQPRRQFLNTSWWFFGGREAFEKMDKRALFPLDLGVYLPLKGKSNNEVAAEARSMHRCQGFGSVSVRGESIDYFDFIKGERPPDRDIFEGINTTWSRLDGGVPIGKILARVARNFNPTNPAASVPELLRAVRLIEALPAGYWRAVKLKEVRMVIRDCLGLYLESASVVGSVSPGGSVRLILEAVNRSDIPVVLKSVQIPAVNWDTLYSFSLENNRVMKSDRWYTLPVSAAFSAPYWLMAPNTEGMYSVEDQRLRGVPGSPRPLRVVWKFDVAGVDLDWETAVALKQEESAIGEVWKPFDVLPPVYVNFDQRSHLFTGLTRDVAVRVRANRENLRADILLECPEGWQVAPGFIPVQFKHSGEEQLLYFTVTAKPGSGLQSLKAVVMVEGQRYDLSSAFIRYDHIPEQRVLLPARSLAAVADVQVKVRQVGYYMGAGDEVPDALRRLGCQVTLLSDADMEVRNLRKFEAIVLGIRAYNTKDALKGHQKQLMEYVESGGTLIVQYNNNFDLVVDQIGPYPINLSRLRVTEEASEIRFLLPEHPLLNTPNKITELDFRDWVQERGLYFPGVWDARYAAPISCNDKGEKPGDGSVLAGVYGKGHFVYTALSFFRELPAGVPGAYRLFANMLSLGK
jgi:LmbE family N-acetylglucosaminyl deacetylase